MILYMSVVVDVQSIIKNAYCIYLLFHTGFFPFFLRLQMIKNMDPPQFSLFSFIFFFYLWGILTGNSNQNYHKNTQRADVLTQMS